MNFIITGGRGFVGGELSLFLMELGHEVISYDNLSTNTAQYYDNNFLNVPNICKDVCDMTREEIEDADFVIHCAAIARIQPSLRNANATVANNVLSTSHIMFLCDRENIPLIYVSSSSVLANNELSPYSESKLKGEEIVRQYPLTKIVRLFNVYGGRMPKFGENSTLVGRALANILFGTEIEMFGEGNKKRDFTHVYDVCRMMYEVVFHADFGSEYNLGTGRNLEVREVFRFTQSYKRREEKTHEAEETRAVNKIPLKYEAKRDLVSWLGRIVAEKEKQKENGS